jgi:hypothetical protein
MMMRGTHRISRRLKMLGTAAIGLALMAVSAQAATTFTIGLGGDHGSPLLQALSTHAMLTEPVTMMVVGTLLLTTFRTRPHA